MPLSKASNVVSKVISKVSKNPRHIIDSLEAKLKSMSHPEVIGYKEVVCPRSVREWFAKSYGPDHGLHGNDALALHDEYCDVYYAERQRRVEMHEPIHAPKPLPILQDTTEEDSQFEIQIIRDGGKGQTKRIRVPKSLT